MAIGVERILDYDDYAAISPDGKRSVAAALLSIALVLAIVAVLATGAVAQAIGPRRTGHP